MLDGELLPHACAAGASHGVAIIMAWRGGAGSQVPILTELESEKLISEEEIKRQAVTLTEQEGM